MAEANLRARVSMDDSRFDRGIEALATKSREAGKRAGEMFKQGLEFAGAFKAFELIGDAMKEAIQFIPEGIQGAVEYGAKLKDLNLQTGMSVRNLTLWSQAMKSVGMDGEAIGVMVNKLQRSLLGLGTGGKQAQEAISALGLNINDLKNMPVDEQLDKVRDAIGNLKNPTDRTAAAMAIFGRNGGEMLRIFANPEVFQIAKDAIGHEADVLQENAENFERVSMLMSGIGLQGFFVGLSGPIVQVATPLLEALNKIDLVGAGQKIGMYIKQAVEVLYNAFKAGKLGKVLGDATKYGVEVGLNYLIGGVKVFGDAMAAVMETTFSGNFLGGMKDGMLGVAEAFVGTMMKFIQPISDAMDAMANHLLRTLFDGFNKIFESMGWKGRLETTIIGPESVEGIKAARIQQRQQQELHALGLDDFDGNREPTADESQKMAAIYADQTDPGTAIGGASSDQFLQVADVTIRKAMDELKLGVLSMGPAVAAAVKDYKPSNSFDTDAAKGALTADIKTFSGEIPGEVKSSENQGNSPNIGSDEADAQFQSALESENADKGGKTEPEKKKKKILRPIWHGGAGGGGGGRYSHGAGAGGAHYSMSDLAGTIGAAPVLGKDGVYRLPPAAAQAGHYGMGSFGSLDGKGTASGVAESKKKAAETAAAAGGNTIESLMKTIIGKMDALALG